MLSWSAGSFYVGIVSPILQIGLLFVILYWLLRALERISAGLKLKGLALAIAVVAIGAILARLSRMHAITFLLEHAIGFSPIVLAIVFQAELRRLFTRMGGWLPTAGQADSGEVIQQILDACLTMSQRRIGALIVLERSDRLDNFIASSPLDCQLTAKSLVTLFWKDSPLHDGGVIIRGGRIAAAGVILPLTENFEYASLSGTRHRAGIGISEDTDALAVLVSEETGQVSIADRGRLDRDVSNEDLEIVLRRAFGIGGRRSVQL